MAKRMTVMGWIGAAAMAMAACDAGGAPVGTAASPLSLSELEARLGQGAARVELKLRADGRDEVKLEVGEAEERLEGRVVALDGAAATLEIEGLGTVAFAEATRFRTEADGHATRDAFVGEVGLALAGGRPVYVRATRPTAAAPEAPDVLVFAAKDLRIEDATESKLELGIDADNFTADPPVLVVLGRSHDLVDASLTDDDPADHDLLDDLGDDHGAGEVESEAGDDHGAGEVEVETESGDHHGAGEVEVETESEAGDGAGEVEVETESGDDHGAGEAESESEAGDDHGVDAAGSEAGDDNGGHGGSGSGGSGSGGSGSGGSDDHGVDG